jgi:hypothetical protein
VSDGVSRRKSHLLENRRRLGAAGSLLDCGQIDFPAVNRRETIFTLRIPLHVRANSTGAPRRFLKLSRTRKHALTNEFFVVTNHATEPHGKQID